MLPVMDLSYGQQSYKPDWVQCGDCRKWRKRASAYIKAVQVSSNLCLPQSKTQLKRLTPLEKARESTSVMDYLQCRQDHGLVTSLAPDAHAKILATAATVPRASVLTVIPGKMLTILASVSNKQCSLLGIPEENRQALGLITVQIL